MTEFYILKELILKDLKLSIRRGFEVLASLSFVLISALLISQANLYAEVLVPALWIVVVFIAVFTTTTSFIREFDSKTLQGLLLSPISPQIVFFSKVLFSYILIVLLGLIEILFLYIFSGCDHVFEVIPIFLIFSFYISIVSAFSSALVMYSEGRGFLIPVIVFVFTIPVIPTVFEQRIFFLLIETAAIALAIFSISSYVIEI